MTNDTIIDLINKVISVQGDVQRAVIWLSRMDRDLDNLMRELVTMRDGEMKDGDNISLSDEILLDRGKI